MLNTKITRQALRLCAQVAHVHYEATCWNSQQDTWSCSFQNVSQCCTFSQSFMLAGLLWAKEGPNSFVVGLAWDRPGKKPCCQRIRETFDVTSNDRRIYVWPDSRKQIVGSWIRGDCSVCSCLRWIPGGTPVCAGRLHWTGPYGQMLSACIPQMQAQKHYATFLLWKDDVTCLSRLSSVSGLLATGGRLAAEIFLKTSGTRHLKLLPLRRWWIRLLLEDPGRLRRIEW